MGLILRSVVGSGLASLVRSVVESLERIDEVVGIPALDKAGEHAHRFPVFVLELVEDPVVLLVLEAGLVVVEDLGVRVSLRGDVRVLACAARTWDVSSFGGLRLGPRLDLLGGLVLRLLWARDGVLRATSWTSCWSAELGVLVCVTLALSLFILILNGLSWAELTTCWLVLSLLVGSLLWVVSVWLHCWHSGHERLLDGAILIRSWLCGKLLLLSFFVVQSDVVQDAEILKEVVLVPVLGKHLENADHLVISFLHKLVEEWYSRVVNHTKHRVFPQNLVLVLHNAVDFLVDTVVGIVILAVTLSTLWPVSVDRNLLGSVWRVLERKTAAIPSAIWSLVDGVIVCVERLLEMLLITSLLFLLLSAMSWSELEFLLVRHAAISHILVTVNCDTEYRVRINLRLGLCGAVVSSDITEDPQGVSEVFFVLNNRVGFPSCHQVLVVAQA